METKVCAKCGKELKDYEVNYRVVDDKTVELCRICTMAVDYKNSSDEEKNPSPVPDEKAADDSPKPPKKLTKADIDLILTPHESEKSSLPLGGIFESNNNIASVMKAAAVLILIVGVIAGIVLMMCSEEYGIFPSVICLASGIIISLLFLALGEIISLLTGINGKMR